ncbi:FkbM family methyltransferase [Streptomyces sp. NRRL B-1347]|uniref:FkbM family methyltransferase n=1 Tax=Streptomyces sp. NRRL B-1347 TaxID=1476877 RepID=UPI000A626B00|nr:FkbM family methyltransferase [Streptomyces sp. NRRL B-1347]
MNSGSAVSDALSEVLATLGRRYVRDAPGTFGKAALATRYLNPWLREHPRERVVDTVFGARFAVDTRDLIQRYLYLFGVWEPHMSRWLRGRLRPGDVFVDVGANIGYLSVLGAQLVGAGGRVVAVEASPEFHRRVLLHRELNGCDNIRAVNAAVSDRRQKLTFVLASAHNMGANSVVPWDGPVASRFETDAVPLPELLEPDEIARARVIKVDVEGAEGSVVRGLAPVLDRLRPDAEIAVEVTPERMAQLGDSVEELLDTMRAHGFHTYRLLNDYAPGSYPAAVRYAGEGPARWRGPVRGETDLIFSRVDAEALE